MDTVRAFIAIELSPPILDRLAALQDQVRAQAPSRLVRWTRPEGIHLTLKFLGDVPAAQVDAIGQALDAACAPHAPFTLAVSGLGAFPNTRRPRVIWAGVAEPSGALPGLQRAVEGAMAELGYAPEKRAFHPHLTLGRIKGRGSRAALETLGAYLDQARARGGEMAVDAVHLMQSELLPGGAVYTALSAAPLASRG